MKRFRSLLTGLLVVLGMFVFTVPALADNLWSEEYYRACDWTGTLTENQQKQIDTMACEFIETYHYDLIVITVNSDSYDGTLEDDADTIYTSNGFGYGNDSSGIICACNAETQEVVFVKYGTAVEEVNDTFLEGIKETIAGEYEKNQAFGVMYVFVRFMQDYEAGTFDESLGRTSTAGTDTADAAAGSAEAVSGDGTEKLSTNPRLAAFRESVENSGISRVGDGDTLRPFWYPSSTENFPFYNDSDIPRVVDEADIFTDEEEEQMAELIAEIVGETAHDIVVFTDTSDYGLGHDIYAADFYDFNGYGIGDENEGMCLMICMDPDNRGWYACATGTDTRSLYTEHNAMELDDALYEYMAAGNYGEGVLDWLQNIRTLYVKGMPFAPDWMPDRGETISAEAAAAAPRVVDSAGFFTEEQIAELEAEIAGLSEKYGIDLVINTSEGEYDLGKETYCDLFYESLGYGLGEDHSGLCLALFSSWDPEMTSYGTAKDKVSDTNYRRLMSYTASESDREDYYQAAKVWLKHVDHMERTGRVARSGLSWGINALLAAILGWILSRIALKRAKKKMDTVALAWNADECIDGQPIVTGNSYIFVRTYETRVAKKIEKNNDRGSSGHSGSSHSYSSSYSGSSGRSHSGSGRSF